MNGPTGAAETSTRGDDGDQTANRSLVALALPTAHPVEIVPASRSRDWMTGSFGRAAKRCLPLMMANEAGWLLINPVTFTATWDGREARGSVSIRYAGSRPSVLPVEDVFGGGTVSWRVPYLFRTPPGWNLLVRGPSNFFKDGWAPLEGVVETDWAVSTFTMNWKITRPDVAMTFEAGEPFCMVLPQRRRELAEFVPVIDDIATQPQTYDQALVWAANRAEQHRRLFLRDHGREPVAVEFPEELQYFRGRYPDGAGFAEHETQMRLRRFADARMPAVSADGETGPA